MRYRLFVQQLVEESLRTIQGNQLIFRRRLHLAIELMPHAS